MDHDPTLADVKDALASQEGYAPGSRYGRHSSDHIELAYAVAMIVAGETGDPLTIESVESIVGMTVNDSPEPAIMMLEYGEEHGFSPLEYEGVESESLPHCLADEFGDDTDGPWTRAAVDALGEAGLSRWSDVGREELAYAARAAYDEVTRDTRERFRAWNRLRAAGHGQLMLDGGTVVLPSPPTPAELYSLTARSGGLPHGLECYIEGGPEDAELQRALAILDPARTPVPA